MESIVYLYQYLVFFYALTLTLIYISLVVVASFVIKRIKTKYTKREETFFNELPELAPGISVVAPAYNEEVIIIDNVNSLLNLNYPNFEVIIVNDGSKDKTLELLISNFELKETPYPYIAKLRSKPVKRIFKSTNPMFDKLVVVDKENGGTKADAMNAGVNIAQFDYFINTDVDCILDPNTLSKVILPVQDSQDTVIAVGATMRMVNGCEFEAGIMKRVRPPKRMVPTFQETEYLRSYLVAKMGWSRFNAIPNVSGGFGLFNTSVVLETGGFDPLSHAEDMDMTLRMIAYMRDNNRTYKIIQIPDTCCWTEGPQNLKVLRRQRTRWGRGLLQIFVVHRRFLFNRRYGRMGLLVMPYALIFELFAPIIEFVGYFFMFFLLITNRVNFETFWLTLFFVYLLGITVSMITITYDMTVKKHYNTFTEYFKLIFFSFFEAILYHPFVVIFSLMGYFQFLTRRNFKWGEMTRQGFTKTINVQ